MSLNQELRTFLDNNFHGLTIRQPLFYNWTSGLRFDLRTSSPDNEEYFHEVLKRSATLFGETFDSTDNVFVVFLQFRWKRRKIRFGNFLFRQIKDLNKGNIEYRKRKRLYEPNDIDDKWNEATIKVSVDRLNYNEILKGISNTDFPTRQSRVDGEVFFINVDKKLIFNMYDDRGLDIISTDKELLRTLYQSHNDWLLDYDREEMKKRFE